VIQQQGADRVVVQLPGVQDTAKAKDIIGRTATLEMRMVDDSAEAAAGASGTGPVPFGTERYVERGGAPLILFGIPDPAHKRIDHALEIPQLGSLILKHDANAALAGLDTIPDDREPPVAVIFWSFRIMVAIGFAMFALGLWSFAARFRGRLYQWRWLHRAAVVMGPSGFVAVIAGWITTEVGRQPYTVYGHLLTAQSRSPIAAPAVAASLTAFVLVYCAVFGTGLWYLLHLMRAPPQPHEPDPARMPSAAVPKAAAVPGPATPGSI